MKKFKSAFTLMEISLVILVLSFLIIISLPIINKQIQKSNEYAYFMAYKTIEKLGSQLVAFGDPNEFTALNSLKENIYIADNNTEIKTSKNSVENIFSNFILQKAEAAQEDITSWSEYEYNIAKLCTNYTREEGNAIPGSSPVLLHDSGDSQDYLNYQTLVNNWKSIASSESEKNPCAILYNINTSNPTIPVYTDIVVKRFTGKNSYSGDIANDLWNKSPEAFCNSLKNSNIDTVYKKIEPTVTNQTGETINKDTVPYYSCILKTKIATVSETPTTRTDTLSAPTHSIDCARNGFINSTYNSSSGKCECNIGFSPSSNNDKVCCQTPTLNSYAYSYKTTESFACTILTCDPQRYNEVTHNCCPQHSKYSLSAQKCICDDGYIMNASNVCQTTANCQAGTHLNPLGICTANAPISKAKRLCELIADNWNINSQNCNTFTDVDNVSINTTLFNNVTVDGKFLSIDTTSKEHVFQEMEPNIVFSNGLKMWILGDKQASIAGLSYNTDNYSQTTNVCRNRNLNTKAQCESSTNDSGYFCTPENQCFEIKRTYTNNPAMELKDARNCCGSYDLSDLIYNYSARGYLKDARTYAVNGFTVFVDIDGDKGEGTLWDDVFPFFVSANGKVIPAYPLNAPQGSPSKYIGGNGTSLTADVYYYDNDSGSRRRIAVYSSIPYARALCFAREISAYTPYCLNLGSAIKGVDPDISIDRYINSNGSGGIPENPCFTHRCFVHVKNKLKFL